MVEHKDANALTAEFHRQLRSAQMSRFVKSQPGHKVQQHLPERFLELLHKLDQAQREQSLTASSRGAARFD